MSPELAPRTEVNISDKERVPRTWQESAVLIENGEHPEHLQIAELVFFTRMLEMFNHPDPEVEAFMRSERNVKDTSVSGLADFIRAPVVEGKPYPISTGSFKPQREDFESSVENFLKVIEPRIQDARNRLFEKAVSWKPHDARREISKANLTLRLHTPSEQLSLVKEKIDYTPPHLLKAVAQHLATIAYSYASSYTLESASFAAGGVAAAANPLKESDNWVAWSVFVVSYIAWISLAIKNGLGMYDMLEETGICPSMPAKLAYDLAIQRTDNETLQKIATVAGSLAVQAGLELPYYIGAFLTPEGIKLLNKEYNTKNAWVSFIAGANFTAAAYNGLQYVIHELVLFYKEYKRMPTIKEFIKQLGKKSD